MFISGYYTRSGYVPGPVCKYNWTKVWKVADERNVLQPQVKCAVVKGHHLKMNLDIFFSS